MCNYLWRILSMGSWYYYYYFTPTSPISWPVYVFQFIVNGIVVAVVYLSCESFLALFPNISSLQLSESCLIYGSLLHVQATVVLFFTLLQYQPTVFLLSYVSCLQLSNCCCSRTSHVLQSSDCLCLLRHSAVCVFIFTVLHLVYPRLHYRCPY